jgi:hypothetical protein
MEKARTGNFSSAGALWYFTDSLHCAPLLGTLRLKAPLRVRRSRAALSR